MSFKGANARANSLTQTLSPMWRDDEAMTKPLETSPHRSFKAAAIKKTDRRLFSSGFQKVAGNDDALDLVGAFIDLHHFGIAHQFLDGVFL